jgi:general secretion pathway protein G
MRTTWKKIGFTLIELMIVIAIIGILAGMAVPHFSRARDQAREKKCWEWTSMLSRLCEQYNIDNKVYPNSVESLAPYISTLAIPKCPMGLTYGFLLPPSEDVSPIVNCPKHLYASASIGAD